MNREFLQLATNYDPKKHGVAGWYMSEKLDGMRCYWDGGVTRGMPCDTVAWANTAKDNRLVERPVATGLWSRYAKVIHAPNWFLDQLPEIPLDGELYLGPGRFQDLISVVKQHNPDERWRQVQFAVFDSPPDMHMFMDGRINNPNCKLQISSETVPQRVSFDAKLRPFYEVRSLLRDYVKGNNVYVLNQHRLPATTDAANQAIEEYLEYVCDDGGEGLMLRKPSAIWYPKRCDHILKVKKLLDSEARVIGYTWGRGKLEGMMGAAIVQWGVKTFELSGFTDAERDLRYHKAGEPGSICESDVINLQFPIGAIVNFRYTELSKDGIPLKARYYRKGCHGLD